MTHLFLEKLETFGRNCQKHQDTKTLNILNASLSSWARYFNFLELIMSRHDKAAAIYSERMKKCLDAMKAKGAGTWEVTQEEQKEMDAVNAMGKELHLDIESFYVFSNILLDRVASTFRLYFWNRADWNERQLLTNFQNVIIGRKLLLTPADLYTRLCVVDKLIVKYRNKRIEHVEEPRLYFGTAWNQRGVMISPMLVYPKEGEAETEQYTTDNLSEIMININDYLIGMLDFFEANTTRSILP